MYLIFELSKTSWGSGTGEQTPNKIPAYPNLVLPNVLDRCLLASKLIHLHIKAGHSLDL